MATHSSLRDWQRPVLAWASTVLVVASLYWARHVLIPVVLAILLTFTLSPVVTALQRLRLGRVPATLIVLALSGMLVFGLGFAVFGQLESLIADLPNHKDEIVRKITSLKDVTRGSTSDQLTDLAREVNDTWKKAEEKTKVSNEPQPVPVTVEESALSHAPKLLGSAAELLITAALVVVLVAFMLIRREDLRNRVIRLWGNGSVTRMTRALDDAAQRISRFLLVQLLINSAFGVALTIGLALIGVPYALLWGLIGTALRYIPYLGAWLSAIFPVLLSIVLFPDWERPLMVLALFVFLEFMAGNVIEPLLFGQSVGVSEVALLVAAAFWTWLWGPIGLILATPLTACLVVIGRHVPQLEFLTVILGDEPALPTFVAYYQRILARDEDEATDLVETYCRTHPVEQAYDEVLLPALVLAKKNRERGELTADDEKFLVQVTRVVLDELVPQLEAQRDTDVPDVHAPPVLVFGCPARDELDELALHMFRQLVESARCRFEVLSAHTLSAEMLARVQEENPTLVCIAALPPEGMAHTRYLCKRLRTQFPELQVLVGCWGLTNDVEATQQRLAEAGASFVATRLLDSRAQLLPLVKVHAAQAESREVELAGHGA